MVAPAAPVQFSNILGSQGAPGPQSPPNPWKQYGDHISYPRGAVVGEPTGDNMGDGALNAEALYINGKPLEYIDTNRYVAKRGDAMDPGQTLVLGRDPTANMEAATKLYVDNLIVPPPPDIWVDVAGDTMIGFLTLNADPIDPLHAATKDYVDTRISPLPTDIWVDNTGDAMTGPLTMNGATAFVTLNADPVDPLHSVPKRYLDAIIGALATGVGMLGVFDATTGTITWNANSGQVGDVLPTPAPALHGQYIICAVSGDLPPAGAPVEAYKSGDWLICNGFDAWFHLFIDLSVSAIDVPVNPAVAGGSNVQDALEGLEALAMGDAPADGTTYGRRDNAWSLALDDDSVLDIGTY